ncbi:MULTISPECIES: ABC transporter ATP-binding protein [unclassified Clostridium]|uniref:ABC transporter ATP-binding protein n=1 Tax=Clostridium TaxID=1485 RepID=UPI001C8B1232|nr:MULTISPECIES: ABC transporter ATP-binding protein [unclassified Clostridium]MBX9138313.1 ABC transporter ATP-binding protein [Clostridium sp. K12(2020)]MBX9145027.1 ABC transporter ATP-binding protein [Clostridium sp. K13]MDU2290884.1 ABC transporter ATP-binding protein [Clostridium celatum]MDU4326716.1 ABC transporter ATP-binding protein [Clostridium celatum]
MESLKWIMGYLKKHILKYSISLILVLVTSLLCMINPFLAGDIIDKVLNGNQKNILIPILIAMIIVVVIKGLITYLYQIIFEKISQDILLEIREDLYSKLLKLDFDYYNNTKTGDIMARMTGDTDALRHFIAWVVYNILSNVSIFIFAIISMAYVNLPLTLFMLSICPVIAILTVKMGIKISPTFYNIREAYSRLNSITQENISGNRVVKAFSREDYEIEKFEKENLNYKDRNLDTTKVIGKYMPVLEYLSSFLSIIMILVGGILVINKSMTLGDLVIFNGLIWALNNPMRMAGYLINDTERFVASSIKIRELLNTESNIKEPEAPIKSERIRGDIIFDNVSFSYGDTTALKNVSFQAKRGQTIGIIGPTGSGKSTLVNLICRFYDATEGKVYIDNVPIKDLNIKQLRSSIGMAMQDIFLFSDTIEGNIAYGSPSVSLEKIKDIAKLSEAHNFISEMPEGYDTIVGERGVGLSGGQRQRISLARALITNPSILILDDTTSAVDMETEFKIQKEVNLNNPNRTNFIIAHRISSVKSADLILVLDNGRIIESGTHDSLVKNRGYYYDVYKTQFGDFNVSKEAI